MAGLSPLFDKGRALANGNTLFYMNNRAAPLPAKPPASMLFAGQETVPVTLLGRAMVDETIDGFSTDDRAIAKPHNFDYSAVHDVQYGFSP